MSSDISLPFAELERTVVDCALLARGAQRGIKRSYKADGSVLTETDMRISHIIHDKVAQLFPDCSFVCEETEVERKDGRFIFVLDPIDGTDVYSQGLPSFAVALAMLDSQRRPVGALIAAPRFGIGREDLLVSLMPGGQLKVDGEVFHPEGDKDQVSQVTMGSNDQARIDFSHFSGKVRTFGSSIIHLIAPVVFSSMQGAVNQPSYVWDVAASHAVLLAAGMDIEYCHGGRLEYTDDFLFGKKKYREDIYAGTPGAIRMMRSVLPLKD